MKLQDQVCTLEQAKRLSAWGIIQNNSLCSWRTYRYGNIPSRVEFGNPSHLEHFPNLIWFDAYSVAELTKMLPEEIKLESYSLTLYQWRRNDGLFFIHYSYIVKDESQCKYLKDSITNYNQAECLCDMLIYLLENNLTAASECNKRLTT